MTALERLKTVLAPPAGFRYRPDMDAIRRLSDAIGQPLPSCYADFLECYGPGYIRTTTDDLNFLTVYGPAKALRQNQQFYNALGDPLPRPNWPQTHWSQPGGWLMWGYSCDGHQYYWRREGEPGNWPIVVEDRDSDAREEFAMSLPEFLFAVLAGEISPRGVPSALSPGEETLVWTQSKNYS